MIVAFYILAALLVYFSFRSFRGGINYLDHFKRELAKPVSNFTPYATIVAPCKGLDDGLFENLKALLVQEYPAYEVIFVVDDPNDPAVKVIEELSRKGNSKMIVAPRATESSQKVENLREAVQHADDRSAVFVFVDSDVKPHDNWLRSLVAPLADETVGAATGYRWFVSENTSLSNELRSAWNASIASALGPNTGSNFCWGGSTAIRREVFERLNIRKKWHGTLSDDFTVTRAMNAAGLPIHFVPHALAASNGRCSARELFEFTNRQMKITRVYARKLWLMSFFGSGLFNGVLLASLAILVSHPAASLPWLAALATIFLVAVFSIGKSWLRFRAVRLVLDSPALARQFVSQMILWLLTPAVFLVNCLSALFSTTITWRGTEYRMKSPTETRITVPSPTQRPR